MKMKYQTNSADKRGRCPKLCLGLILSPYPEMSVFK
jgi:hypothetical protein